MEARPRTGIELVLLFVPWCALVNLFCISGAPRRVYFILLALAALILATPGLCRLLRRSSAAAGARSLAGPLLAGALLTFGWFHLYSFWDQVTAPRNTNRLVDIAENTYAAGKMFFTGGVNPYTFRGQIWHDVTGAPHVTVANGKTYLYGFRYKYGYTYFPWMFVSYEPFRQLIGTFNAVRIANLLLVALSILALALLARRLAPRPDRGLAALAVALCFLSAKRAGYDLYSLAVTDVLLSCYLLFGYLALERGRDVAAGVCFGLAEACKLLPAGLMALVVLFWYRDPRRRRRFLVTFAAVAAAIVGPFLLWDPEAFFSATILYYLTFHADGDGSSYYGALPGSWRMPFQLAHGLAIIATMLVGLRDRRQDPTRLLVVSSVCYLIFIAGNKMVHMNYLWSVFGPTCAAFVLQMMPPRDPEERAA